MLIQRIIKIRHAGIRLVIKVKKGDYAFDLLPKFRKTIGNSVLQEKITMMSVMEVIS